MSPNTSRRLLQAAVAVAGLVPVGAGAAGVLGGPAGMLGAAGPADLDSHYRYLSGLLLGIGLVFWSLVPTIERRRAIFTVLTAVVFAGGLARLFGVFVGEGAVGDRMPLALVMELAVTPALWLWQGRVAREKGAASATPPLPPS